MLRKVKFSDSLNCENGECFPHWREAVSLYEMKSAGVVSFNNIFQFASSLFSSLRKCKANFIEHRHQPTLACAITVTITHKYNNKKNYRDKEVEREKEKFQRSYIYMYGTYVQKRLLRNHRLWAHRNRMYRISIVKYESIVPTIWNLNNLMHWLYVYRKSGKFLHKIFPMCLCISSAALSAAAAGSICRRDADDCGATGNTIETGKWTRGMHAKTTSVYVLVTFFLSGNVALL